MYICIEINQKYMALNESLFEEVKKIFTAYLENKKLRENSGKVCDFGGDLW
jgi:hypothetical protein